MTEAIFVEPYQVEHGRHLGVDARAARLYAEFPAVTIRVDGNIAVCAGIVLLLGGASGEAWMVSDTFWLKRATRPLYRTLRSLLDTAPCARLQATIPDSPRAARWAQAFDFQYESDLSRFGPSGETYFRYARFKEQSL